MSAQVLDGSAAAKLIRGEVLAEVTAFKDKTGVTPTIAVIRAGEDPGSVWYAKAISKTMTGCGMSARVNALPDTTSQLELLDLMTELGADSGVHGIMVQEPMPDHIDEGTIKAALSPEKDIDGVHDVNAGRLSIAAPLGRPAGVGPFLAPATPAGGMELMRRYGIDFGGKQVVVVGRSAIVGKPLALMMLRENATVTVCHSRTRDLPGECRRADILCVAIGRPEMVRGDWIKPGSVVIDFGVNEVDGHMVGDVAYAEAMEVAGMITPVPGGTGPMTNVTLCRNLLAAAKQAAM